MSGKFLKDDLSVFFNTGELADSALWQGRTIPVVFFNEFEAAQMFGLEIESAAPHLLVQDSDIQGVAKGVQLLIGSAVNVADDSIQDSADTMFVNTADNQFDKSGQAEYYVQSIQPDGTGVTTLILSKDKP